MAYFINGPGSSRQLSNDLREIVQNKSIGMLVWVPLSMFPIYRLTGMSFLSGTKCDVGPDRRYQIVVVMQITVRPTAPFFLKCYLIYIIRSLSNISPPLINVLLETVYKGLVCNTVAVNRMGLLWCSTHLSLISLFSCSTPFVRLRLQPHNATMEYLFAYHQTRRIDRTMHAASTIQWSASG